MGSSQTSDLTPLRVQGLNGLGPVGFVRKDALVRYVSEHKKPLFKIDQDICQFPDTWIRAVIA